MKLNLGGGIDVKTGYTNVDLLDLPQVDLVCDVTKGIPLEDNSVNEVVANHFLEHIADTDALMNELYRVCKNGAIIKIKVPYFKSIGAFKDPTHVSFFTERTFEYYDPYYAEQGLLPEYKIKVNFKVLKIQYLWANKYLRFIPGKMFLKNYLWNIIRTMYIELEVRK